MVWGTQPQMGREVKRYLCCNGEYICVMLCGRVQFFSELHKAAHHIFPFNLLKQIITLQQDSSHVITIC